MGEKDNRPDPANTRVILDNLKSQGFDDDAFRRLHHFGGSMKVFYDYAPGHQSFQVDGNNHRVHQRLQWVKDRCLNGKPPLGKTFAGLTAEALNRIPTK